MNTTASKHYASNGEVTPRWAPPTVTPASLSPQMAERWRAAVGRACVIAEEKGWSRAELARQTGIPNGTLTPLLEGGYTGSYGNQVAKLEIWLSSFDEIATRIVGLPEVPTYFETPTSRRITDILLYSQQMPQMAVVTTASGMGKSSAADAFRGRPGVYLATMRPVTRSVRNMLSEIAIALDVQERSVTKLDRAIGGKIKRNGRQTLLIVDEAQNLADEAIDQLRYFYDVYRCGIALLGNEEIYARYGRAETREGFGQIHRRIGMRFRLMAPTSGDIETTIDAWAVADGDVRKLLRAIARKPGALGQITETMKLATILAAGDGAAAVELKHVRQAWENRGGDEGARP